MYIDSFKTVEFHLGVNMLALKALHLIDGAIFRKSCHDGRQLHYHCFDCIMHVHVLLKYIQNLSRRKSKEVVLLQ